VPWLQPQPLIAAGEAIADELRAWEKTFPASFGQSSAGSPVGRATLNSRPKWWGKLVIELIYDTLDPDVAEYLKNNKPPQGVRWHRQLTENIGVRPLVSRCYEVIGMAKERMFHPVWKLTWERL
jgi:hypothetical protein